MKKIVFILAFLLATISCDDTIIWVAGRQFIRQKILQNDGSILITFTPVIDAILKNQKIPQSKTHPPQ